MWYIVDLSFQVENDSDSWFVFIQLHLEKQIQTCYEFLDA